jgi:hypothetical protein
MRFVSEIEGELPAHDGKSTIITADDLMDLELDPGTPYCFRWAINGRGSGRHIPL